WSSAVCSSDLAVVHVLSGEDRIDRDYIARYTTGYDALAARAGEWTPERAAEVCRVPASQIVALAPDYGTIRPAAIRLNYGLQRVAGGGNAVRAIACLPALVGAWRNPAGGALLSTSGTYPIDTQALERPRRRQGGP